MTDNPYRRWAIPPPAKAGGLLARIYSVRLVVSVVIAVTGVGFLYHKHYQPEGEFVTVIKDSVKFYSIKNPSIGYLAVTEGKIINSSNEPRRLEGMWWKIPDAFKEECRKRKRKEAGLRGWVYPRAIVGESIPERVLETITGKKLEEIVSDSNKVIIPPGGAISFQAIEQNPACVIEKDRLAFIIDNHPLPP